MPLRFRILASASEGRAARAADVVSAGLADGPLEERWVEVDAELKEIRFGRQRGVEIELPFPAVSSLHARLLRGEGTAEWQIEDLGSMNGTWLDGVPLARRRPIALRPGQRLRFATVDMVFEGRSAAVAAAETTGTIARRLISDLFGAAGGEVPMLAVEFGISGSSVLRLTERDRRYLVGRAPSCDLVLASDHVSREHIALVRRYDGVVAFDLGSKNGAQINGIGMPGEQRLSDGDRVTVGDVTLRVTDPEDRYHRRLEFLGGSPSDRHASESGSDPGHSARRDSERNPRIPTPAMVHAERPSPVDETAAAPSISDDPPGWSARPWRWLGTALIVLVMGAAVAGLIALWFTTH